MEKGLFQECVVVLCKGLAVEEGKYLSKIEIIQFVKKDEDK